MLEVSEEAVRRNCRRGARIDGNAYTLDVPLLTEVSVGPNWNEMD